MTHLVAAAAADTTTWPDVVEIGIILAFFALLAWIFTRD